MLVWWVHSYSWQDHFQLKFTGSEYVHGIAGDGRMCVWFEHKSTDSWYSWYSRELTSHISPKAENRIPWFDVNSWPTFVRVYAAHWVLAAVSALLAWIPWCPRRFSLRGLAIATTVISILFGIVAWVDNNY